MPLSPTSPLRNNDRLSEARAETAASLLVQGGLPPDRIRTQGRGAREPVAANDTRAGRALNRRIEILVGKQL